MEENTSTELRMTTEELFWLHLELTDNLCVGAWVDYLNATDYPTEKDLEDLSMALTWIQDTRTAYDDIHGYGATEARGKKVEAERKAKREEYQAGKDVSE